MSKTKSFAETAQLYCKLEKAKDLLLLNTGTTLFLYIYEKNKRAPDLPTCESNTIHVIFM